MPILRTDSAVSNFATGRSSIDASTRRNTQRGATFPDSRLPLLLYARTVLFSPIFAAFFRTVTDPPEDDSRPTSRRDSFLGSVLGPVPNIVSRSFTVYEAERFRYREAKMTRRPNRIVTLAVDFDADVARESNARQKSDARKAAPCVRWYRYQPRRLTRTRAKVLYFEPPYIRVFDACVKN